MAEPAGTDRALDAARPPVVTTDAPVLIPGPPVPRPRTATEPRVRIGEADLACISMTDALDRVRELATGRTAALVVTANADHIVRLDRDPALREAYRGADLAVIDGRPLVWAGRLMRVRAERITGVDLFERLCAEAGDDVRLFLLGGSESNSERAEARLRARFPRLNIVGRNTAWVGPDTTPTIIEQIRASGANVTAVFYGCPKQEVWVSTNRSQLPGGAYLCLGGTIDIVSGALPRAGRVWQSLGLEWLHRLLLEPRRLWRRYLVDDPKFAIIALKSVAQTLGKERIHAQKEWRSRS